MKRRTVLRSLAALPATGLLKAQQPVVPPNPTPTAVEEIPVIESTIPDIAGTTVPSFFSQKQLQVLRHLCDLIAPSLNGVPGAIDAHTPEFLDFLVGESPADRQRMYREGLDELDRRAQHDFHTSFPQLSSAQATLILAPLSKPWTASADEFTSFLRAAKQDILNATQNSHEWIRVVSKQVRSAGGLGMYWFPID